MKKIINPSKYDELLHFFLLKSGQSKFVATVNHSPLPLPPSYSAKLTSAPVSSITLEDNKSVFLLLLHQPSYDWSMLWQLMLPTWPCVWAWQMLSDNSLTFRTLSARIRRLWKILLLPCHPNKVCESGGKFRLKLQIL